MSLELFAPAPPAMVRQCFEIRHEIYCVKLGWEPLSSDGLERQEQDAWSHQVLVHEGGRPVATTRVTPMRLNPKVAELGRTAMLDTCKNRRAAVVLLVEGVKQIIREFQIEHCMAFMEERMVRLERWHGFVWEDCGPLVEHNGTRQWRYMWAAKVVGIDPTP